MKPIYLEVLALLMFCTLGVNTTHAQSPTIFFSTPAKQVFEGDRLTVDVKVQSASQSINAVSGAISFPLNLVNVASVSKDKSIITLWTREPKALRNQISFEGVVLNPGFQGSSGTLFQINLVAKKAGTVSLNFTEGAILANDGQGTNLLAGLGSTSFRVIPGEIPSATIEKKEIFSGQEKKLTILPVIIDYSAQVESKDGIYIKGRGEPNALTKIIFKNVSLKSIGEQLVELVETKNKKIEEVLLSNDPSGEFQYMSSKNLVAGVYNATPFLVDENTNTEKPGPAVQLLVSDSKIVKALVVVINVLGLLIPVVLLGVIIYFIPWYSFKRMRVIKNKLRLEEEKVELAEHQLERQDKLQGEIGSIEK
jgi:hypothetical protein